MNIHRLSHVGDCHRGMGHKTFKKRRYMKTMRLMILALAMVLSASVSEARTLIVYYSYTNHVKEMAAVTQTFLFMNRTVLATKQLYLMVSSYSSSISGVEEDAHRLIPTGSSPAAPLCRRACGSTMPVTPIAEASSESGLMRFTSMKLQPSAPPL